MRVSQRRSRATQRRCCLRLAYLNLPTAEKGGVPHPRMGISRSFSNTSSTTTDASGGAAQGRSRTSMGTPVALRSVAGARRRAADAAPARSTNAKPPSPIATAVTPSAAAPPVRHRRPHGPSGCSATSTRAVASCSRAAKATAAALLPPGTLLRARCMSTVCAAESGRRHSGAASSVVRRRSGSAQKAPVRSSRRQQESGSGPRRAAAPVDSHVGSGGTSARCARSARRQRIEDASGGALWSRVTTQPSATYPAGGTGRQTASAPRPPLDAGPLSWKTESKRVGGALASLPSSRSASTPRGGAPPGSMQSPSDRQPGGSSGRHTDATRAAPVSLVSHTASNSITVVNSSDRAASAAALEAVRDIWCASAAWSTPEAAAGSCVKGSLKVVVASRTRKAQRTCAPPPRSSHAGGSAAAAPRRVTLPSDGGGAAAAMALAAAAAPAAAPALLGVNPVCGGGGGGAAAASQTSRLMTSSPSAPSEPRGAGTSTSSCSLQVQPPSAAAAAGAVRTSAKARTARQRTVALT
jgi:hypothetical protein